MTKKIACVFAFLTFFVSQILTLPSMGHEGQHTHESPSSEAQVHKLKMSREDFFKAINMPEYNEYLQKSKALYEENKDNESSKFQESMKLSKKLMELYNERYEEIKKGFKKYEIPESDWKYYDYQPLINYTMAAYADASTTKLETYTMAERYFLLLKVNKLFDFLHGVFPDNQLQYGFFVTSLNYLNQAKERAEFTDEEIIKYENLVSQYDFKLEEMRTLPKALELIEAVDKAAKEYKPKKAKKPEGEKVTKKAGE